MLPGATGARNPRATPHKIVKRDGWPDYPCSFHDSEVFHGTVTITRLPRSRVPGNDPGYPGDESRQSALDNTKRYSLVLLS